MLEGLFQPMHLLVILVISMFVFGPKRFAELGKGLGDGIRSFKGAMGSDNKAADEAHSPSILKPESHDRPSLQVKDGD